MLSVSLVLVLVMIVFVMGFACGVLFALKKNTIRIHREVIITEEGVILYEEMPPVPGDEDASHGVSR